jgi:hypothetical protein
VFVSVFKPVDGITVYTWTVLQHEPDQIFGHDNLVEPGNVRVEELAMVVDFAGKVGVFLAGRLEHDLPQLVAMQRDTLRDTAPWSHW